MWVGSCPSRKPLVSHPPSRAFPAPERWGFGPSLCSPSLLFLRTPSPKISSFPQPPPSPICTLACISIETRTLAAADTSKSKKQFFSWCSGRAGAGGLVLFCRPRCRGGAQGQKTPREEEKGPTAPPPHRRRQARLFNTQRKNKRHEPFTTQTHKHTKRHTYTPPPPTEAGKRPRREPRPKPQQPPPTTFP